MSDHILDPNSERDRKAMAEFRRLIIYACVVGVVMVIGALFYVSLFGPLTVTTVIATTLGVFFSVLLGAGLMAAGFLSSNSGHDERAAGASVSAAEKRE